MKYDVIIGMEIHAELKTKSKMFCSCSNNSEGKAPNTTVCPICLGHPGTLPVPNKQAIDWTLLIGLALNCQINLHSKFDRKNYFYPDLPKGYQISQYDQPFCYQGSLDIGDKEIAITRIHLEEDTGKSFHPQGSQDTLIDFNRAGTPLVELVTEPVIQDAEEAKNFCQAYQRVLRFLEASNADMEKGEMRCEANISLQKPGAWAYQNGLIIATGKKKLNAKVEVKNINSFRAVEKAINYEIARQSKALDNKEEIIPETRGWDEKRNETVAQRKKETAADYRYFPEPDIPPIIIDEAWLDSLKQSLVELPDAKQKRFQRQYGLKTESATIIANDKDMAAFFENVVSEMGAWIEANGDDFERQDKNAAQMAANWITSELLKNLNTDKRAITDLKMTAENFAELMALIWQNKINSNAGQRILEIMYWEGGDPSDIMTKLGLEQLDSEEELETAIRRVIQANPAQTEEYRNGKTPLIQFFIGKVMAETKGKANPEKVRNLLGKILSE
ncbi:MAG: Asp-tRNA(Asn)/Glu-tRNA(Gln) amidotransferase subunit GatB [Patescibacteria group bacterium]|nr:Asp-tRNA(Asn)/Glu-tRNA(Gln) amidotransferase subunit GatB [Patescibacteria group bacterium]